MGSGKNYSIWIGNRKKGMKEAYTTLDSLDLGAACYQPPSL